MSRRLLRAVLMVQMYGLDRGRQPRFPGVLAGLRQSHQRLEPDESKEKGWWQSGTRWFVSSMLHQETREKTYLYRVVGPSFYFIPSID